MSMKSFIISFIHFFICLAIWNVLTFLWEEEKIGFESLVHYFGSELAKMILVALVVSVVYELFSIVKKTTNSTKEY